MILPENNLTFTKINEALGTSHTKASLLCKEPNINMWAKYKPVRHASQKKLTEAERRSQLAYTGEYSNYGILVTNADSLDTLKVRIIAGDTHRYAKPDGSPEAPYRLGDFTKYENTIVNVAPVNTGVITWKDVEVGPVFSVNPSEVTTQLVGVESNGTKHLMGNSDCYPVNCGHRGVMLENGSDRIWKTGDIEWSNPKLKSWMQDNTSLDIVATEFMTNYPRDTWTNPTHPTEEDRIFYAILKDDEFKNPYTIKITKNLTPSTQRPVYTSELTAIWNDFEEGVQVSLIFKADGPSGIGGLLKDIHITVLDGSTEIAQKKYDDTQIQKGGTIEFKGILKDGRITKGLALTVRAMENKQELHRVVIMVPR